MFCINVPYLYVSWDRIETNFISYRSAQYVRRLAVDADISIDFVSVRNHRQTK